jgi:hypothetical protein
MVSWISLFFVWLVSGCLGTGIALVWGTKQLPSRDSRVRLGILYTRCNAALIYSAAISFNLYREKHAIQAHARKKPKASIATA